MPEAELETSMTGMRARYAEVKGTSREESFLLHVRSLSSWEKEPMDRPTVTANFPKVVHVAYAVCHPDCTTEELIVDGVRRGASDADG